MKLTLDLIISELKQGNSPSKICKKYNINKYTLQYYLDKLKKQGIIEKISYGVWKVNKEVSKSTKYRKGLKKDSIRGHAYIWNTKISKIPRNWNNRIKVLKKRKINYKLVGAKGTTPRIKVLGRKVWLCNTHLRIYDKKEESYYGDNAKESRLLAFQQIKLIVGALNRKLGTKIKPSEIFFQREHYSLIKNDLAIEENRKGNIWRITDQEGEWLLVDDSLDMGGELETVGKHALKNNIPLQKWWNDHKKNKFEVSPSYILDIFNKTGKLLFELTNELSNLKKENKDIQEKLYLLNCKNPNETNINYRDYIN